MSWRRDKQRVVPGKMDAPGTGSQLVEPKRRESLEVSVCVCVCGIECVFERVI